MGALQRRIKLGQFLAAAGVVVLAAVGAFFIGRTAFSSDSDVRAQIDPDQTPVVVEHPPHPDSQKRMDRRSEDAQQASFIGELNGISFVDPMAVQPEETINGCPASNVRHVPPGAVDEAVQSSELDFQVTWIPDGFGLTNKTATECDGEVVTVGKAFDREPRRFPVSVNRAKREPVFPAVAPESRLEARSIAGRASVVVLPRYEGDVVHVFMYDDEGTSWALSSNLALDELIDIAESTE